MQQDEAQIRPLSPSDYNRVIAVVDDWWGGRQVAGLLQRLFFEHFADTSLVAEAEAEAEANGILAGFLIGFCSPSRHHEAYIHFVGVHPGGRGLGLGRRLYETFFAEVAARGRTIVRSVTSPVNTGSVAFHRSMGFEVERGDAERDGVAVTRDYDGRGQDRVRFVKHLSI